jgi:hypothetical protein
MTHRIEGQFVRNELETTWKETTLVSFKVASRNFSSSTEEYHDKYKSG